MTSKLYALFGIVLVMNCAQVAMPPVAKAQALSPMRQAVTSFTDQFVIRVSPKNPYRHRIRMQVRVYDQNFRLVRARVSPRDFAPRAR